MPEALTAKQRDTAFRQWSSQIAREGRDMAGLERVGARALLDRQVHADALLQSMVRVELERQRGELQRETQRQTRLDRQGHPPKAPTPSYHGSPRNSDPGGAQFTIETGSAEASDAPPPPRAEPIPPPPPPDPDQAGLSMATGQLNVALKIGDEDAARSACADIRALHERRSDMVSAGYLAKCENCVANLRTQLIEHRRRVAAIAAEAVARAQEGDAAAVARLIRRLNAIHAAHPRLLDDASYEQVQLDVAQASESREDRCTTRKLLDRERAVAGEMRRLASAVFDFHAAVFGHTGDRAQFRRTARVYLRALRQTRLLAKDWLAEFVLELGDVLANWSVPPPGAEKQIDKFLERLRQALQRIHAKMNEINTRRDEITRSATSGDS